MILRHFSAFGLCLGLAACATEQLNYNTADQATTVDELYTKQVLINFSKLIDNQNNIPSITDLASGTIQSTLSLTPSATSPLSSTVARNGAGSITSLTTTGAGFSISGSDSVLQNWIVSPVVDANSLRNFRALYRYALYGTRLQDEYLVPRMQANGKYVTDPYFLQEPQCVICSTDGKINKRLHPAWIYWKGLGASMPSNPPPSPDYVSLGVYGQYELFVSPEAYRNGYLQDFTLFMLATPEPGGGGSAPAGSSKAPTIRGRSGGRNVPFELVQPIGPTR